MKSNLAITFVDSVRNGLIGALVTKRKIKKNEELSSFYGYDPNDQTKLAAKWYLDQLEAYIREHPEFEQSIKQEKEEN